MSLYKQPLFTLLALLALLAVTVGAAFLPIGAAQLPLALLISIAKAVLIVHVFMRFSQGTGVARLAFAAGFIWLVLIVALSFCDYLTRA